ncbi:MATE family efflux transporter [Brucepastera parasyntrophica]|uniref:MATE family efflux transporter n=1 Tax=Brucepastera parasyntrophica TaxID=2880008 RepID=UPI00210A2325|nr:MATE family efflux transporter [Brucepastera parasyntrophica]ULQ60958.1 MATE family efflux transporter [Brucepastera parasyntrophica]
MNDTGSLYKQFAKYVSLNILSMIGLSCYIFVDTFFISFKMGSDGLAALNIVLPVYGIINGLGLMLGIGAATLFTILQGRGRPGEADSVFSHALMIAAVLGLVITCCGFYFIGPIAKFLGASGATAPLSEEYARVIFAFTLPFILNNILVAFVRNDHGPRLAMTAMLAGSLGNIILDYVFMFPLDMGMFGAALATGFAPLISMLILSVHFIRKNNSFRIARTPVIIQRFASICSLGVPSFVLEFSSGIILFSFNQVLLRISGNSAVAAYGIVANLAIIVVAIFTGIGQGVQPLISRNFGINNMRNVYRLYGAAVGLAFILGTVFYLIGFFFPGPISSIFNTRHDEQLGRMAATGIRLYFLAFFVMGFNNVTISFFSSISQPAPSFIMSISKGIIITVPVLLLFSQLFGITGVWLTVPAAEFLTMLMGVIFLLTNKERRGTRLFRIRAERNAGT